MSRLLLKGGHVLDAAQKLDGPSDLAIVDGEIDFQGGAPATETLDVSGCFVMPGFIDLRCHVRDPDDLRAALRGGFTTVLTTPDSASFSFEAVRVIRPGYLTHPTTGELEDSPKDFRVLSNGYRPVSDAAVMRRALQYCAEMHALAMSHAEEPSLSVNGTLGDGPTADRLGLLGVPASAETVAVARDLLLLEETGGRLHFSHLTTARALALLLEAKGRGLRVTADVALSHLVAFDEVAARYQRLARVHPVLHSRADRSALIEGVRTGAIDAVASDHVSRVVEDQPFEACSPGRAAHPGLWRALLGTELPPAVAAAALTAGPARVLGLDLGHLRDGARADVTIVDRETAEVRYVFSAGVMRFSPEKVNT